MRVSDVALMGPFSLSLSVVMPTKLSHAMISDARYVRKCDLSQDLRVEKLVGTQREPSNSPLSCLGACEV